MPTSRLRSGIRGRRRFSGNSRRVNGMRKDFIRYYIGGIHFSMFKTVQRESGKFDEWELLQGSDFILSKSYGYKADSIPVHDKPLLKALVKRSVIAETKQPTSVKPSLLWGRASNIADILTLLSLARGRYHSAVVENNRGQTHGISWDLIAGEPEGNWDIVPISNLGRFISEALTYIDNNTSWLKESGFDPSVYWFTQAQKSCFTAPSILEMGLYWVSLEVLSLAYIAKYGINVPYKKERVKCFITDRGYTGSSWDFLEEAIDDWYVARNDAFHEGKEKLSIELIAKRGKQIRDFTSLVFVEMLQKQEDARKKEIAMRMQSY
jgi:hypothetical protein